MHGEEGSAGALGQLDEILPAVGIAAHVPHDALHLFVVDEAVKATHAMAFDEGNHVVFKGGEIVWNGRHIWRNVVTKYCMLSGKLTPILQASLPIEQRWKYLDRAPVTLANTGSFDCGFASLMRRKILAQDDNAGRHATSGRMPRLLCNAA
jgi:hypothetical protein